MKIYEIKYPDGECEWVAGINRSDAIANYLSDVGVSSLHGLDIEKGTTMIALSRERWKVYHVTDEDGSNPISFEQWMNENPSGGLIAGTMYY